MRKQAGWERGAGLRQEGHVSENHFLFGSDSWSLRSVSQSRHTLQCKQVNQQEVEGLLPKNPEFLLKADSLPQKVGLTERRTHYFHSTAAEAKILEAQFKFQL